MSNDYRTLNGQDAFEFIFRVNNKRRHNLKGQRAMGAVKAREESGRSKQSADSTLFISLETLSEIAGVSEEPLSHATVIWNYAPEHVNAVIGGSIPLDKAYEEAKQRRAAAQSKEAQMERLRKEASDVADLTDALALSPELNYYRVII